MKEPKTKKKLTAKHKSYLATYYLEGLTNAQVAKKFNIGVSTFSAIKASERGQEYLEELGDIPRRKLEGLADKAIEKLTNILDSTDDTPSEQIKAIKEVLVYNFAKKNENKNTVEGNLNVTIDSDYDGV